MKMPNKHSAPRARLSLRDGGAPVAPTVPSNWTDSVLHVADVGGNRAANSLRGALGLKPSPAPIDYPGNMAKIKQMLAPPIDGVQPLTPRPAQSAANPAGIQFNSGGDVPGEGKGDKIPAMYEPGEFVVSNAMLDAEPELRGELHELREKVLAKKGMTPEEADEKALKPGRGLRAQAGFDLVPMGDLREVPRPPGTSLARTMDNGYRPNFTMGGNAPAAPAMAAPGNPNVGTAGSAEARAWQTSRAAPAAPAPAPATPNTRGSLRNSLNRPGAAGLLAATSLASSADSLGTPTENYRRRFGMDAEPIFEDSTAGRVGQAASDIGLRLAGSITDFGAKILDTPVDLLNAGSRMLGGKGDVQLPGGSFRDIVTRNDGGDPGARPAPGAAPNTSAAAPAQRTSATPTAPTMSEGKVNVTTQPNGVTSFTGKDITGTPEYTGSGAAGLRGGTVNSMPAAQFTSSGFGGNDAALSAARAAAAQRGDIEGLRASYGPQGQAPVDELAGLRALASNPDAIGHNGAARLLASLSGDATARRGQDMAREDARAGRESTARAAGLRMQYDMDKDNRDFQRNVENDNFTQGQAAQKAVTDEVASYIPPGPDGKPDMARTAQMMKALNAHVAGRKGELQRHLQLNPGDKAAASELAGLEKRGVAMMDAGAKRKFIEGQMAIDAGKAGESDFPFIGSEMVEGDAPIRSLRREEALFGHNYRTNRGDLIPGRAIDKTDTNWFGLGGRRNTNFDNIIEK